MHEAFFLQTNLFILSWVYRLSSNTVYELLYSEGWNGYFANLRNLKTKLLREASFLIKIILCDIAKCTFKTIKHLGRLVIHNTSEQIYINLWPIISYYNKMYFHSLVSFFFVTQFDCVYFFLVLRETKKRYNGASLDEITILCTDTHCPRPSLSLNCFVPCALQLWLSFIIKEQYHAIYWVWGINSINSLNNTFPPRLLLMDQKLYYTLI